MVSWRERRKEGGETHLTILILHTLCAGELLLTYSPGVSLFITSCICSRGCLRPTYTLTVFLLSSTHFVGVLKTSEEGAFWRKLKLWREKNHIVTSAISCWGWRPLFKHFYTFSEYFTTFLLVSSELESNSFFFKPKLTIWGFWCWYFWGVLDFGRFTVFVLEI